MLIKNKHAKTYWWSFPTWEILWFYSMLVALLIFLKKKIFLICCNYMSNCSKNSPGLIGSAMIWGTCSRVSDVDCGFSSVFYLISFLNCQCEFQLMKVMVVSELLSLHPCSHFILHIISHSVLYCSINKYKLRMSSFCSLVREDCSAHFRNHMWPKHWWYLCLLLSLD